MQPQTLLGAGLGAFVMMVVGVGSGQFQPTEKSAFVQAAASETGTSSMLATTTVAKSDKFDYGRVVRIEMLNNTQFPVIAWIGNMPVTAIIDTGSTGVTITESDAERLGQRLQLIGPGTARLANGSVVPMSRVMISVLEIGSIEVRDVEGGVSPGNGVTLIGMSFLNKIKRFTIENRVATLEQ